MVKASDSPPLENQKERESYTMNDIRYSLIPKNKNGGSYRPRANSGVVLLAAGFDNLPPPPK